MISRRMGLILLLASLAAGGCTNSPYPGVPIGGKLAFSSFGEDPKTLDPAVAYDTGSASILAQICDTFLQYRYLKRPVALEPLLGAKMPERKTVPVTEQVPATSAHGKPIIGPNGQPVMKAVTHSGELWTFTIKRGIYYNDDPCFPGGKGREVVAADFVYAIKRLADPSLSCPILNYLTPHILGLQDFFDRESARMGAARKAGKPYAADLSAPVPGLKVDVRDPYTFYILLRDPYPQLRYLMAMQFTAPMPHEAVEYYDGVHHEQIRKHPVGAGPYYLKEWDERHRIVLQRNPHYHTDRYPTEGTHKQRAAGLLRDAGKPLPFDDTIIMTFVPETIPGWNLFEQGYLDSYGVPKEAFDAVITPQGTLSEAMRKRGITLETTNGMDVDYLAFNMEDSLVGGYTDKKRKLRQALSLAFDSNEYIELVMNGRGTPAQGPLPPGLFGYDPHYKDPFRQTNLDRAKQLLAEAGYPGGVDPSSGRPLVINYDDSGTTPSQQQANGLVIRQLERLGIKINERQQTFAVFQDRVNAGEFQLVSFGWVADYPDPENFFLLFYGPNKGPGPNAARYANPEFDALYRKMAGMDDGPERIAVIKKMRDILAVDCPWIYNYHSVGFSLRHNWVHNAYLHPVAYNSAKYIRIDGEERERRVEEWNHTRYSVLAAIFGALLVLVLPGLYLGIRRRKLSARATRQTLISSVGPGDDRTDGKADSRSDSPEGDS